MTTTRANLEVILVKRCGALLEKAGLSADQINNEDLNDPIGYAVRQAGGSVANIGRVTDTDVATVSDTYLDKLLDFAEFRTLQNISGNLDIVNITVGPRSEDFSDLVDAVEARLKRKESQLKQLYGFGLNSGSGLINLLRDDHGRDA